MTQSILARLNRSHIKEEPFPHIHVTEALDPAYYEELEKSYPSLQRVAGSGPLPSNKVFLLSAREVMSDETMPEIWRDFFRYHTSTAFMREAIDLWRPHIERLYPDIESRFGKPLDELTSGVRHPGTSKAPGNREADVMLDVQFGINSPVTAPSSVRGAHVDRPVKLFAGLIYFRMPGDDSTGGDLGFYRYTTKNFSFDGRIDLADKYVERVAEAPYRPNSFVMWLNNVNAIHGVSPRQPTPHHRRYVNFIGECYALQGDMQGLFPIQRSLQDRATIALRRFAGFRDA